MISIIAALFIWFLLTRVKAGVTEGAKVVGAAIDPTSDENLFYRGVNAIGNTLDDGNAKNDSFSLGGWFADLFPSEAEKKANAMIRGQ